MSARHGSSVRDTRSAPGANGPGGGGGRLPERLTPRMKAVMAFFLLTILLAAVAFGVKFYEFFIDLASQEGFRFAGAELLTYLLVAGGFFLLLAFAFLNGHFADIERPKYDLLEEERRHDELEFGQR